ncbi:MAG: PD40 domain-containing protein [Planctomycetes bacterium]|nr:PD40 domain-containing protein [Planctomycetota bacterium]
MCEGYENDNWDIFLVDPHGSRIRNLTRTPHIHEMYPQVSPDGTKIAFVSDRGNGRATIRSVWVMDIHGKNRHKVADYARQPFWSPDGKTLGYLPQEYKKFSIMDFGTKGMMFCDVNTWHIRPHPNAKRLFHLYNPGFSPDGKWIVATVHAGMGFKHADILIQADGPKIVNLHIKGCRPCFSPDGKYLAWGHSDHEIRIAPVRWGASPSLGEPIMKIVDKSNKIYHVDWSPDGKWVSISRGPKSGGDISKPGTFRGAAEIVGVYAAHWNIFIVRVRKGAVVNLLQPSKDTEWLEVTHDGNSYKESDWIPARQEPGTQSDNGI